jgi:hypothetical protein
LKRKRSRNGDATVFSIPGTENPAIHAASGKQFQQVVRATRGAAGGIKVAMNRSEEQTHGAPNENCDETVVSSGNAQDRERPESTKISP